ncbi:MAG: TetR/AcrR family transcriptional regulator [Sandaracinaceae bacterium]|nr:TetR/AcrR family transcriptional regulator [Sandaracinaceae bacterium]
MDIRTQILEAATRRFAAQGFGATSLAAIADDVGIRKASLLYHFPSKDALHQSVLDNLLSHWNETLPRLLEAAAGEDRFDALLDETVRFFAADPDRARLLLREALDRPDAMRERLRASVRPWMRVIASSIEKGQEHGELRADADPEAYLLQVIHLVVGGVATADTLGVLLSEDGEPADVERLTRELTRVARASLFTDEGLARMAQRGRERRARASAGH